MRELKGNFRDIFNGFSVALDAKKLFLAFAGAIITLAILAVASKIVPPDFCAKLCKHGCPMSIPSLRGLWNNIGYIIPATVIYLLLTALWAYCGGAISRIAAINLTKDEGLELSKALHFSRTKWLSLWTPWVVCILGFLFFFACNVAGGLVGRIPFIGGILVALGLPLAVLSGFIMAFILIGFFFGVKLFTPTIAVENSDSFVAISRSFSYLYSRPWHYIFYELIALVYGAIVIGFVWFFSGLMIKLTLVSCKLGIGTHRFNEIFNNLWNLSGTPTSLYITKLIIGLWTIFIIGFILVYAISYCFSAQTIIYLLLRKKVDEIDVKEIYEEKEEDTTLSIPEPETPKTEETK
jgi:hypothetical protein